MSSTAAVAGAVPRTRRSLHSLNRQRAWALWAATSHSASSW